MEEQNKDQEKTEQATPKKRRDAREKGQVAKSQDAASVAVLLAGLTFIWLGLPGMIRKMTALTSWSLSQSGRFPLDCHTIQELSLDCIYKTSALMLPLFLTVFCVALFINYVQVGFIISSESVQPKLSKIDPVKGFKRLISVRSLVELVKNICKISIVGLVVYLTMRGEIDNFIPLADQTAAGILHYITTVTFKIIFRVCLVLIILAILDYSYQKWEFEKNLRMSRQEVKDEFKQTEGNPLIKSRIKSLQREAARKRMMASVPKADVVITNPTRLAVALIYDQGTMAAPTVVAKGARVLAEKIKEIARENKVPIVENKPLAQVLYIKVDVDEMIPANLYKAVAEVLAFVYNMKRKQ